MRKKIIGIFVVMLLITCSISYSVAAFSSKKNSQLDDEKVLTNINDPLTMRAEVKEIGYRIWLLKAYAKNTWQERITVKWGLPCFFNVRYLVPGEEGLEIVVFYPYNSNLLSFLFSFDPFHVNFKPGEEKLVEIAVFCGISNWILPLIADNCTKYFESFPILPEGNYRFEAGINPYYVNSSWRQYGPNSWDDVVFHLAAPK